MPFCSRSTGAEWLHRNKGGDAGILDRALRSLLERRLQARHIQRWLPLHGRRHQASAGRHQYAHVFWLSLRTADDL